jgi:tRNA dimethylallyltransferase
MPQARRLLAVVGPTGTGKSALAISLAAAFGGEVVNADAYSLYRGLDIGTAKVSAADRGRVPHHLIDVATPDDQVTLARYLDLATAALEDIWERGRQPVLAGGSGQYVWALLEGWSVPRVPPDDALRTELEVFAAEHGAEAVHARLAQVDPEAAARLDPRNLRRVIRALEVVTRTGLPLAACQTRQALDADVLILGLHLPRDDLYRRLDDRVEAMFAAGLVAEVERLRRAGYGDSAVVRGAIGYREVSAYLDGAISLDEAVERTKNANHRLVRRQANWFKEDDARIHWLDAGTALDAAPEQVSRWLEAH